MKGNIILFGTGLILVFIPLTISFILKFKNNTNKELEYTKTKYESNTSDRQYIMDNMLIIERIKKLEREVLQLREENEKIKKENSTFKNNNFKPILNYNLFAEKNSKIIELYKEGKNKEEIAKVLNKSIREVEMVINLLK